MDNHGSNCWAQPSGLRVPCDKCGEAVPYDPTNPVHFCPDCLVAWSSDLTSPCQSCGTAIPYHPTDLLRSCSDCQSSASKDRRQYTSMPSTTHPEYYDYSAAISKPIMTSYSDMMPQPAPHLGLAPQTNYTQQTFDGSGVYGHASDPFSEQHMPPSGFLQQNVPETYGQHSPHNMLVRRTVVGAVVQGPDHAQQPTYMDEEGEDEFVDAPEEQPLYHSGNEAAFAHHAQGERLDRARPASDGQEQIGKMGEASSLRRNDCQGPTTFNIDSMQDGGVVGEEGDGDEEAQEEEQEEENVDDDDDDDDDLFAKTFRNDVHQDSDDEVEEVDEHTFRANPPHPSPKPKVNDPETRRTVQAAKERSTACSSTRQSSQTLGPPGPPDGVKDRSYNYTYLTRFYHGPKVPNYAQSSKTYRGAKGYIPRLPLEEHRYWIGVLNIDRTTFDKEKHFTWMKGNRLTTVSTVYHTYQQSTATDGFVLLLGMERVAFGDKMEELDYDHDKKVIFRAVDEKHEHAGGRSAFEGLIPKAKVAPTEVIELD